MKKILFILGLLSSLSSMSIHAEQTRADVYKWNHGSIMNGRERSSVYLPTIDIVFDSNDRSIEILCSDECEALVLLYDISGNLIAEYDSMKVIQYVPESINTIVYLKIESEFWYATATISL